MEKLEQIVQWRTESGDKVTLGDVSITPQSQALTIRWPFGGFVWNRPAAILVERGAETERIPILDVTRVAQLSLLGFSLLFFVIVLLVSARPRREQNE